MKKYNCTVTDFLETKCWNQRLWKEIRTKQTDLGSDKAQEFDIPHTSESELQGKTDNRTGGWSICGAVGSSHPLLPPEPPGEFFSDPDWKSEACFLEKRTTEALNWGHPVSQERTTRIIGINGSAVKCPTKNRAIKMNVCILNHKPLSSLLLRGSYTSVRWSSYTPWAGFGYFLPTESGWPQKKMPTEIDVSSDETAGSGLIAL